MSSLFLCLLSRILLYGFTTICLSIDVHFSCLQFLATINAANRNIHVQVFVWICILISLEQVFRVICICVCVCTHTHIFFFFNKRSLPPLVLFWLHPTYPHTSKGRNSKSFQNGVSVSFKLLEVYWDVTDIQRYVSLRCAVCWFDKSSISFWLSHVSELADRSFSTASTAL